MRHVFTFRIKRMGPEWGNWLILLCPSFGPPISILRSRERECRMYKLVSATKIFLNKLTKGHVGILGLAERFRIWFLKFFCAFDPHQGSLWSS